jgi:hypothetical protein
MTRVNYYYLIVSPILLFSYSALAQSKDSVFQVNIRYSNGQWDFKLNGIKSSEEFILFKKYKDSFILAKYFSVEKLERRDKTLLTDTFYYPTLGNGIQSNTIETLISNLNQDKNNGNENYARQLTGSISDKQILLVAKEFKFAWMFKTKYSTKAERKSILKNIKSFKLFDEFYNTYKPWYPGTEQRDTAFIFANKTVGFTITTYSNNDTIQYLGQLANLMLQPFSRVLDASTKKLKCAINLDVNILLLKILPGKSKSRKYLEEKIAKYYIRWSLENENMWE